MTNKTLKKLVKDREIITRWMSDTIRGVARTPVDELTTLDKKYDGWWFGDILLDLNEQVERSQVIEALEELENTISRIDTEYRNGSNEKTGSTVLKEVLDSTSKFIEEAKRG